MENLPNQSVDKLLEYRENEFDRFIELGRISLTSLDEYKELAETASEVNILARFLPQFSMSLFDHQGSWGAVETACAKELQSL